MQEISSADEGITPVFSTMEREPSMHKDFPTVELGDTQHESETSPRSSERTQEVMLKLLGGECLSYLVQTVCTFLYS